MRPETLLLVWWLNILNKKRYDALIALCGSVDHAFERPSAELFRVMGMRDSTAQKTMARIKEFDAAKEHARLEQCGAELVSIEDDQYPRLLRESADPPICLSYRGDLSLLDQQCIAIVGTRLMSDYGKRLTEWIVPPLVQAQMTTVSGLAFGIDAVVARSTLNLGGHTVAVFGSGLGLITPREHEHLADEIVKNGGLLLSEYPLDAPSDTYTYPARNRIIAGLSLGTIVIEAPRDSGALITARFALEENREVFAFPGTLFDENMEGNHRLIAEGQALLLRTPDDVFRAIGMDAYRPPTRTYTPVSADEAAIYTLLASQPLSMDDLVEQSGRTAGEIGAHLTLLELAGATKKVGNGWVRC